MTSSVLFDVPDEALDDEMLNDPESHFNETLFDGLVENVPEASGAGDVEVYALAPMFSHDRRGAQWNADTKQTEIWRGQLVTLNLGVAVRRVKLLLRHANQEFSNHIISGCGDGKHNHPLGKQSCNAFLDLPISIRTSFSDLQRTILFRSRNPMQI